MCKLYLKYFIFFYCDVFFVDKLDNLVDFVFFMIMCFCFYWEFVKGIIVLSDKIVFFVFLDLYFFFI